MRAVLYIRVSTDKQAKEGLSLEAQQALCVAYIEAQGWTCVETFVDADTGRKDDRPALQEMLGRLGDFDVVIAPKLDRLGRSARDTLNLYDRLEKAGVAVVTLKPQLDTTTPAGRMMRTILAAAAEFESDMIAERVVAVNAGRARAGKYMGAVPPFGFRRIGGVLAVDPSAAAIVERIFREYAAGRPMKQIARGLNADGIPSPGGAHWRQSRISTIIRNPIYIGRITYRGEEFPGAHDAIIAPELWEAGRALAAGRDTRAGKGRGRPPKGHHLFVQGLLRCAHCGYAMAPRTDSGREHYICMGRADHGPDYCPQSQIPRAALDAAAFDYFEHVALDVEAATRELEAQLDAGRREARGLLADARRDLAVEEAAILQFDRDYGAGLLDVEEWRLLRKDAVARLRMAQDNERLRDARVVELEGDATAPARAAVLARVAELRRAVAGQVAGAEGLEDVRGRLLRLFERFDVGRTDVPPDDALPRDAVMRRAEALADLPEQHITFGDWVLLPWARLEAIAPLEMEWRPALDK